jgi:hypothetical protein
MTELTDDEFTILLLGNEGESLAPIGRWKVPILALTERGLMQRFNDVNYGITQEGRDAVDARNAEDEAALRSVLAGHPKTIEGEKVEEPEELKDGGT